jgi:zinc transport system substrate-binding protein
MAAMLCVVLASCGKKETANPEKKRVAVVTTLFPLYDFARSVGQDKADVTLLLPPGVEAHTFEPRPGDIVRINVADVFVYTGRFMEPWVDDLLKSITNKTLIVVDSSEGLSLIEGADQHEEDEDAAQENDHAAKEGLPAHGQPQATHHHGRMDPHIWLDFSNAQKMVDTICAAMVKKDPQNKDFYIKNAGEYKLQLDRLDQEYRGALASCKYRTIIHAGHFAFGYLAKRYGLTFLSAYKGFTPDAEPTPKNMSELIEKTRQSGVKYVYYEELISPKVAKTLAEETGVGLLPLNGAHNVSKEAMARGDTFLSIMQRNLESLKKGLECR